MAPRSPYAQFYRGLPLHGESKSVIFRLFFPMKFQAEMAFLLALILLPHIVGALVFIPSMVSLFKPRFATLTPAEASPVAAR